MAKIVKCGNCGTFQISNAKTTFKCIKCFKSKPIDKKKIYFETEDSRQAIQVLQKIKEEDFKQKQGDVDDGFKSAL